MHSGLHAWTACFDGSRCLQSRLHNQARLKGRARQAGPRALIQHGWAMAFSKVPGRHQCWISCPWKPVAVVGDMCAVQTRRAREGVDRGEAAVMAQGAGVGIRSRRRDIPRQ